MCKLFCKIILTRMMEVFIKVMSRAIAKVLSKICDFPAFGNFCKNI
jgi:hypothetical protein